jgi:hypothetical protein
MAEDENDVPKRECAAFSSLGRSSSNASEHIYAIVFVSGLLVWRSSLDYPLIELFFQKKKL